MNNWKNELLLLVTLVLLSSVPAVSGQTQPPQTQTNSAVNSRPQDINAKSKPRVLSACSAAADELIATRELAIALDDENATLRARLDSEKQVTAILTELNTTRASEAASLRVALEAKNETIRAKESVISTQDKLIDQLKRKPSSPWRRIGDILIGAAVTAVLK